MEELAKKRRLRNISSWMADSERAISNQEENIAGKSIVLKILRYMEENRMTQKELALRLDVTPQYINKFLHGQECDIKISTALRYGRLLGIKLIEIPENPTPIYAAKAVIYTFTTRGLNHSIPHKFSYTNTLKHRYKYYKYN